jgi:HK97 family phage portal protein
MRADTGLMLRPDDDLWYQRPAYHTATGLKVSPDSAMRVAAVFACVRVIAETVASLPLVVYRTLPNGGKERAENHPAYKMLHQEPNDWQTTFEFLEMMQGHIELRGNAYAHLLRGMRGGIEQMIPLHPDRVQVFRLPNGRLQYQVRYLYSARIDTFAQEEILHLRGLSSDGFIGMSTIGVGAETVAAGLAAQQFASRFFENDATPSGVVEHPKSLTDAAHARLKQSWREQHAGVNQHSVAILEEGMKYTNIGLTNRDSQLLEARQFSRGDIASIFRVPPHKIGDLSRATFSNIEQQNIEFATDSVRPRLVRLQHRINMDIVRPLTIDGENYFCEFQMDALLRGDQKSRYEAYSSGINAGWLNRNEARAMESMNPIEGLDEPLMPLNMVPVSSAGDIADTSDQPPASDGTGAKRLEQFVRLAAERVVRREVKALRRLQSHNGTRIAEIREFYRGHAEYVHDAMQLEWASVQGYVGQNCERAVDGEIEGIEQDSVEQLVTMALNNKKPTVDVEPMAIN